MKDCKDHQGAPKILQKARKHRGLINRQAAAARGLRTRHGMKENLQMTSIIKEKKIKQRYSHVSTYS